MIKTLKGNNGSFASLGSVQIQAVPSDSPDGQSPPSSGVQFSVGRTPVRQEQMAIPVLLHTTGSLTHVQNASLSQLASMVASDPTFVFPLASSTTQIVPTNNLELMAGKTYDPNNTGQSLVVEQFHPFELATGISQARPEIVMLSGFLPLFETNAVGGSEHSQVLRDVGLPTNQTDAGRFIDAQFNMRSIQSYHAQSHVRDLRTRYQGIDNMLVDRTRLFSSELMRLRDDASFLLNAIRMLNDDKRNLDLRSTAYRVQDPASIARYVSRNFDQLRSSSTSNRSVDLIELLVAAGSRSTFDFIDCMHDLGYTNDNVRGRFTSTKVWMQSLHDLKRILQNHTMSMLDIDPLDQRRDASPISVNKSPIKHFGIAETLPSLPTVSTVINLKVQDIPTAIGTLQAAFSSIYQNAFFKNEESRIAALAHMISREYRYSHGLSLKPVQEALERFYQYAVVPAGNTKLFDSIIGVFGNNITDFSDTSGRSLVSIAQSRPQDGIGMLTFESDYVEADSGTLTPGGEYVFDRVMAGATSKGFDTRGCDFLADAVDAQLERLLIMVDSFNLLMIPSRADIRKPGGRDANANFLAHPLDTVSELASGLINISNGKTLAPVLTDKLGSVYTRALADNRLKTMLFMHTMSRISRAYVTNVGFLNADKSSDNTPLSDELIDRIIETLKSTVPETRSTSQLTAQKGSNASSMTPASMRHALKTGTVLSTVVEGFMSSVIDWYKNKSSAITADRTRYGGYIDTVIMMMAFDLAIAMVAKYAGQQIVGKNSGMSGLSQGQVTFAVTQSVANHQSSMNELVQRLNKEGSLVRQIILTVTNALLVMAKSAKSTSNFFKGPEARKKLTDLLSGLNGDVDMLRLLLTEQQAMLMSSAIENLVEAHASPTTNKTRLTGQSSRHVAANEVSVLDGSDVPPETQDVLYSMFELPEYASRYANNKKIMTIGIPLGLMEKIKQSVDVRNLKGPSSADRRTDIVQVTVYKIDMQNVDIVFKPMRFLFEMSRFPVRYSASRWLPIRQGATLSDIIGAVPTRNFDQGTASARHSTAQFNIEYASTSIASNSGIRNAKAAFDDASYSFLTAEQKAQILHNHVLSQLLEIYIKMMTGMDVSEETYHIIDPPSMVDVDIASQLVTHSLARLSENASVRGHSSSGAQPSGGVVFSSTSPQKTSNQAHKQQGMTDPVAATSTGLAGKVSHESQFKADVSKQGKFSTVEQQSAVGSTDSSLDGLSHKHVPAVTSVLRAVSRLSSTTSPLALQSSWKRRVVAPKQFDRVFNVIIDPRDFEIDLKRTLNTPYGKQAFDLLINHGEIEPASPEHHLKQFGIKQWGSLVGSSGPHLGDRSVGTFRFRSKDKNVGDLVADKYFVTIETIEEGD